MTYNHWINNIIIAYISKNIKGSMKNLNFCRKLYKKII